MHHVVEIVGNFDGSISIKITISFHFSHRIMTGKGSNECHNILRYVLCAKHIKHVLPCKYTNYFRYGSIFFTSFLCQPENHGAMVFDSPHLYWAFGHWECVLAYPASILAVPASVLAILSAVFAILVLCDGCRRYVRRPSNIFLMAVARSRKGLFTGQIGLKLTFILIYCKKNGTN